MPKVDCDLYRKTAAGTDPEVWEPVDGHARRLSVSPVSSDRRAIEMMARSGGREITHVARGEWDDEFEANRLLKRRSDGKYFQIVSMVSVGRPRRGAGNAPRVRLNLSVDTTDHGL